MRRSSDRILTTHVGSLPRPPALREAWSSALGTKEDSEVNGVLQNSVSEVVAQQRKLGIDIPNERVGVIPTRAWKQAKYGVRWVDGDTPSIAIGQGRPPAAIGAAESGTKSPVLEFTLYIETVASARFTT